jgi:hypothetical protein
MHMMNINQLTCPCECQSIGSSHFATDKEAIRRCPKVYLTESHHEHVGMSEASEMYSRCVRGE